MRTLYCRKESLRRVKEMQNYSLEEMMNFSIKYGDPYIVPVTDETQFKFKVVRCANRVHGKTSKKYFADYESAIKYIQRRSYNDLD